MSWERAPELIAAADAREHARTAALVDELIAHLTTSPDPYATEDAARVLKALRDQREFALLARLADAFIQAGQDAPIIRRFHAQALLDQGALTSAEAVLKALVADTAASPADRGENREARGLLGRAYKQMYVAAGQGPKARRRAFLERAIAAYADVYAQSPEARWHGINAVALLDRARRDGIELTGMPDPGAEARRIAEEIAGAITDLGDGAGMWDYGTKLEAYVALGNGEKALAALADYLRAGVKTFQLGTTLRQLIDVWGLDPATEPGSLLLGVLQAELLRREGGAAVVVGGADLAAGRRLPGTSDQKVLGRERFQTLKWFQTALERCRGVARIEDPIQGGLGTGFLVEGAALGLPDDVVLVTNAHVIPGAVEAERAHVTFRALDATPYEVARTVWSSTELDVTLVVLDGRPERALCCPLARRRPRMDSDPPQRTYIIGHPGADEDVLLSLRDNDIVDADETYVQYRTPTLGGSSGSPVFNQVWDVIAVHHAGDFKLPRLSGPGTHEANEGIWMDRAKAALLEARSAGSA